MVEGNDNYAFMQIVWRLMDEHPGKSREELFPLFLAEVRAAGNKDAMISMLDYALDAVLREEGSTDA